MLEAHAFNISAPTLWTHTKCFQFIHWQECVKPLCKPGMGIGKSAWGVLTEPEWPRSRGCQGPGGVQGQCPAGGSRGAEPPGWKRIWVFWRPVSCLSVHRNCENHFFFFLPWSWRSEPTFHYFLYHPILKTTNIKSDNQDHKLYSFPLEHFKIYMCMSHDLPYYQSWDDSSSPTSYKQFINYEKSLMKVLCLQIL